MFFSTVCYRIYNFKVFNVHNTPTAVKATSIPNKIDINRNFLVLLCFYNFCYVDFQIYSIFTQIFSPRVIDLINIGNSKFKRNREKENRVKNLNNGTIKNHLNLYFYTYFENYFHRYITLNSGNNTNIDVQYRVKILFVHHKDQNNYVDGEIDHLSNRLVEITINNLINNVIRNLHQNLDKVISVAR